VRGELLDGIAAVHEYAGIAVDVGDLALGAGRGHEPGVEGEDSVVLVQRADVHDVGADRAGTDGEVGLLAGSDVKQLEFLGGHVFSVVE